MGDVSTDRLDAIPWAQRLLRNPKWTIVKTPSRLAKSTGQDSFFAETLATDRTMRSCTTLRPAKPAEGDPAYAEIVLIVEVGDALNGFARTLHGGMAATLLDEVCGVLITLNVDTHAERSRASGPTAQYLTAYLNTTYKRPIHTPGAILCTAKIERQEGRKLYVGATIEDGLGTICTIGQGLFIRVEPRL
ncbi:hypothetical protein ACEQ8H_007691 [Pleosporales sp. CAS-2024a]